ncbi:MAG: hypothetical protein U1B94_01775 [candidate division NC10 bacterium]|nr:hypothetical protein [candidate division NC10 bacterium]
MKNQPEEKLFTWRELLLVTVMFSIYAWSLLRLDPEWVMWMGFTTLGTTPPPALPPPLFSDGREAFQVASILSFVGVLALVLLFVAAGDLHFGWFVGCKTRWDEWRSRHARERRDVATRPSLPDVDPRQ